MFMDLLTGWEMVFNPSKQITKTELNIVDWLYLFIYFLFI